MTEREWRYLLDSSNLPKIIYRNRSGFATSQPIWCLRDGDDLITVTWSQSALVKSIERGETIQVWVDLEEGHVTVAYEGEATLESDPMEVEVWSQWIWRHLKGPTRAALSPKRCDVMIRFTPVHCSETIAEQSYQLRHAFPDDSGATLEAKILYNLNDLLQNLYLSPLASLDSVALIHNADLGQELPTMASLRVPSNKLITNLALGSFLEKLLNSNPEWLNMRVYLQDGNPRLLAFSAQEPSHLSSRETDPQAGASLITSWRSDVQILMV